MEGRRTAAAPGPRTRDRSATRGTPPRPPCRAMRARGRARPRGRAVPDESRARARDRVDLEPGPSANEQVSRLMADANGSGRLYGPAPGERPPERQFVRVLEVGADR